MQQIGLGVDGRTPVGWGRWSLFGMHPLGLPWVIGLLVVLADVFFYRQWVGWTLGGFSAVVVVVLLLRHGRPLARRGSRARLAAWAVLLLLLSVSFVLEPGLLGSLLMVVGVGSLVLAARRRPVGRGQDRGKDRGLGWRWLGELGLLWLTLWVRPLRDCRVVRRWYARGASRFPKGSLLWRALFLVAGVLVPAGLGLVFLAIFSNANPVIARWFGEGWGEVQAVLADLADYLGPGRFVLWLMIGFGGWGLLRHRGRRSTRRQRRRPMPSHPASASAYLAQQSSWGAASSGAGSHPSKQHTPPPSPPARPKAAGWAWPQGLAGQVVGLTVKSLLVLNAVFLVQILLDARYLLLGSALPEGMTYAQYAHRGAYPLIAAALLAGGLVLAVFRPGGPAERSAWARGLVLFWIGQTTVLVGTAAWRLGLYVEVYALTRWRSAAAVWMLMVAGGLVLLIWRIVRRHDSRWLTRRTMGWGLAVLYACCFVPFDPLIAQYNVGRCREMAAVRGVTSLDQAGQPIDVKYLQQIGPDALPAIDRLIDQVPAEVLDTPSQHRKKPGRSVVAGGRRPGQAPGPASSPAPAPGPEILDGPTLREQLEAARRSAQRELDDKLSGWRGWTVRRAWLASRAGG